MTTPTSPPQRGCRLGGIKRRGTSTSDDGERGEMDWGRMTEGGEREDTPPVPPARLVLLAAAPEVKLPQYIAQLVEHTPRTCSAAGANPTYIHVGIAHILFRKKAACICVALSS